MTPLLRSGRIASNLITRLWSVRRPLSSNTAADSKIASTQRWVEQVVIGEKLCPFAAPLLKEEGLLRIVSSCANSTQDALEDIQREVQDLMNNDACTHETTLVVLDQDGFVSHFRDLVRLSWTLQEQAIGDEYVGKLQLVLFHPRATHQTYNDQDDNPADYTIRSPYPTIHLLREQDVLKAVTSGYPDLEYLPSRNQSKLMQQGIDVCRSRLENCYVDLGNK